MIMYIILQIKLPPIRTGESGESYLIDNKVPISHTWSPSFVPRCHDWPSHVDVVGELTEMKLSETDKVEVKLLILIIKFLHLQCLKKQTGSSFQPDPKLAAFLDGSADNKPIYVGFGSMVIEDSSKLVQIIKVLLLYF